MTSYFQRLTFSSEFFEIDPFFPTSVVVLAFVISADPLLHLYFLKYFKVLVSGIFQYSCKIFNPIRTVSKFAFYFILFKSRVAEIENVIPKQSNKFDQKGPPRFKKNRNLIPHRF